MEISKVSPGVTALVAGATLQTTVDTTSRVGVGEDGAAVANVSSAVIVQLQYLQSYEGQGIVSIHCLRSCWCAEQRIDAHKPAAEGGRNESVFAEYSFGVTGRTRDCGLRLRVLEETSSGGHGFKVRTLVVMSSDAAEAGL